jgi:NTE family protein
MPIRLLPTRISSWLARGTSVMGAAPLDATTLPERTAFVLLGGGARGAAQAGALTVLLEQAIVPDVIVGISAGSWNGAYLAVDPTPARAIALEQLWVATTSQEVIGTNRRLTLALNAVANRVALYDSTGLRRMAERHLQGLSFADLRIPLEIVATELYSGQPYFFTAGALLPAILASSAVPGVFPPVTDDGRVLVDGGLCEWQGCLRAVELGARRVYLVSCGAVNTLHPRLDSFRRVLARSMEVSNRSNFLRTVCALRGAGVEVIPIFPELPAGSLLDFDRAPVLIQAGRAAAREALRTHPRQSPAASPVEGPRQAATVPALRTPAT